MQIPIKPGVDVELDREARVQETYENGMTERDDLHTMQLVQPGWSPEPF